MLTVFGILLFKTRNSFYYKIVVLTARFHNTLSHNNNSKNKIKKVITINIVIYFLKYASSNKTIAIEHMIDDMLK